MQLHQNKAAVNGVQKLMLMEWRNLRTSLYQTQLTLILITSLELELVNTEIDRTALEEKQCNGMENSSFVSQNDC